MPERIAVQVMRWLSRSRTTRRSVAQPVRAHRSHPLQSPAHPLLLPAQRSVPRHLDEPKPLRLSPVEDGRYDVRRHAGQRHEAQMQASVTVHVLREIGDRFRAAALDPPPPAMCGDTALIKVPRWLAGGAVAPSGVMISLRPPRRA